MAKRKVPATDVEPVDIENLEQTTKNIINKDDQVDKDVMEMAAKAANHLIVNPDPKKTRRVKLGEGITANLEVPANTVKNKEEPKMANGQNMGNPQITIDDAWEKLKTLSPKEIKELADKKGFGIHTPEWVELFKAAEEAEKKKAAESAPNQQDQKQEEVTEESDWKGKAKVALGAAAVGGLVYAGYKFFTDDEEGAEEAAESAIALLTQ